MDIVKGKVNYFCANCDNSCKNDDNAIFIISGAEVTTMVGANPPVKYGMAKFALCGICKYNLVD